MVREPTMLDFDQAFTRDSQCEQTGLMSIFSDFKTIATSPCYSLLSVDAPLFSGRSVFSPNDSTTP